MENGSSPPSSRRSTATSSTPSASSWAASSPSNRRLGDGAWWKRRWPSGAAPSTRWTRKIARPSTAPSFFCPGTGRSFDELEPRLFSFNSPHGWCPHCQGFGTLLEVKTQGDTEAEREVERELAQEQVEDEDELLVCPDCQGQRLNPLARAVRLPLGAGAAKTGGRTVGQIGALSIVEAQRFFRTVKPKGRDARIARDILPEIVQRLSFLVEVGLGYLTLDRSATTLSGGESQRIRLAAQFGSELQGVLYVLDEPTIGLHPRDNARLLDSLGALKAKGNTLVVVEHDEDTMRFADRIIDLGPGAGAQGGRIVAQGSWRELAKQMDSPTGAILGQPLRHPLRGERRPVTKTIPWCRIEGAHANNLKQIDARVSAGRFIALCGVSGAGKSTLLHDVIKPAAQQAAARAGRRKRRGKKPAGGPWDKVTGFDHFTSVYEVDQAPIGKTSRSTPATYIGLMDELRALFARLPLGPAARLRCLAVFLQQRQRALSGMPRPGRGEGGDEFPALDLRAVRNLPWPPLQSGNAGGSLQRKVDLRRARPDHRAGGRILRRRAAAAAGRSRCCAIPASATSRSASAARPLAAERPSGSSWSPNSPARWK